MNALESSMEIAAALEMVLPENITSRDLHIVCIGTDRSTGDSYGPLVGTQLKQFGYEVAGDLNDPVHAMNLIECIENVPEGKFVLAIDACLGDMASVGKHIVKNGPLKPGAGVGKELPEVGNFSITATVNVGGFMEYFVLQNTRLATVMDLAQKAANAIHEVLSKRNDRVCDLDQALEREVLTV